MDSQTDSGRTAADVPEKGVREDYERPNLVVLGHVAELTQQGSSPSDELLLDGSQP
jgi:hypothetical protein